MFIGRSGSNGKVSTLQKWKKKRILDIHDCNAYIIFGIFSVLLHKFLQNISAACHIKVPQKWNVREGEERPSKLFASWYLMK